MRVIAFGTYDVESHPRVGVLVDGLRESGFEVVECNAPLGLGTAARVRILQRPWLLPQLGVRLLQRWTTLARAARRLRRESPPDAVLVGYLGHFDVLLARRLFRDVPIVLDHLIGAADTARDRGETSRLKQGALARLDRAALGAADIVLVDTEEQRGTLSTEAAAKAVVVPVGARRTWFAAPRPAHDGPLRVVFFGLYTPLQGTRVIGAALARLADGPTPVEVTMIGTGQEYDEVRALVGDRPRVSWLDWVAAADLPALVAAHDVCLGIFGTNPKALRVVPNKVYQGAAAGCAVVTADTVPQRRVLGDGAVLVPPGDAEALTDALVRLAEDRDELARAAAAAYDTACRDFAPREAVAPLATLLRARRQEPA
ncbi:group 1 glycosyl transferase [Nocardioides sp. Root1257]|uniref:glycosyltransferase family 4 protein n=1 Tax=unclassified Nocardioides TaxID=2615069 RepID=UPI0006F3960E|nr:MULTISPECIES: glycosyltransferase family 4 protein [unclassified Nocardioides]KQW52608.1 group 1 glycosyl transferase [Nocardioides sp. Root1257]KRC54671.1 group 1 glycosyl transferase [Nocardioides sp. Root224]